MNPVDIIELAGGMYACIYPDCDAERPFSSDDSVRIVALQRRP